MAQSIDVVKRNGQLVVDSFNKRFPPNTPCFFQPFRNEDKWLPTRTRSEAWLLGHGEPVVKVDGASGGVLVSHLAMPGSDRYEASICEAEEARAAHDTHYGAADEGLTVSEGTMRAHGSDWVPFPEPDDATSEPDCVYQYSVWVNTERGRVTHDGVIVLPMIRGIEGYMKARDLIAADMVAAGLPGLSVSALNVTSLCIVGEARP